MADDPEGRDYFLELFRKLGNSTPQTGKEVHHEVEVEIETIQPVMLETIEVDNFQNVMGPSKGKKKGHKSGKRSHSSSKRYRYMVGSSSQVLPETVFTATTHFSNFVQVNMNEPPCDMLKTSNIPSLADSIVELASHALLIGKVIKEESANGISAAEFERLKKELTESGKNLELALEARSSLTGQVKELSNINTRNEAEIESLKVEIASLTAERLKLVDKNDHLEKSIFELSSTKNANAEKMQHLEEEISQLKRSVLKAERFVVDQHKLGFSKALQQAKYFYKIPLDEGNFDFGKDLYNNELIPIEDIPRKRRRML